MRSCHGFDPAVECGYEGIHPSARLARMRGDDADSGEYILHAVVELADQYALALFCPFALGDVSREAFDAKELSFDVKFAFCRFLQPYLSAVRTDIAEAPAIRRVAGTEFSYACLEFGAVVGMDKTEEVAAR